MLFELPLKLELTVVSLNVVGVSTRLESILLKAIEMIMYFLYMIQMFCSINGDNTDITKYGSEVLAMSLPPELDCGS